MRPRHKTAENVPRGRASPEGNPPASMRPRHKTAENTSYAVSTFSKCIASMRPRHKTAENQQTAHDLFQRATQLQ